ncbi:nicotinamide N-methyltransferase [Cercophora newfieldiana]|uniref:Nicotinamide N-methyltransferase n=1 Tax=Cercophora newfieldiana TaxID=92897 RepID=A0AA39YFT4_9PEZI|nr:nicotinamide N-methyltransferase [Cercophora newfieldiana]
MSLTARLSLIGPPESDPEDFLATSLGVIFPDDVTNQHGDAEHGLEYKSPHLPKPLQIILSDPKGDRDRSLFSHFLWNSSLLLAELVEAGTLGLDRVASQSFAKDLGNLGPPVSEFNVDGLATFELGAGTALPSVMSTLLGARRVVVTDYPAPDILKTLRHNVSVNTQPSFSPRGHIGAAVENRGKGLVVESHSWGQFGTPLAQADKHAFDRVFVADCLWMPWQHENLRQSISWFLRDDTTSRAWVVAGFHTGREKMRGFFDAEDLKASGLEVERIWERDCDGVDREWVWDRGFEDPTVQKRWLVVAILRRARSGKTEEREGKREEGAEA